MSASTSPLQNHDSFGSLLRTLRTRSGMTQQQLADLSALSVRAVRDLESERVSRPRPETVRLLADGLRLAGGTRERFVSAAAGRISQTLTLDIPPGGHHRSLSVIHVDDGDPRPLFLEIRMWRAPRELRAGTG
ncbi:helix-turn-helix domain-containing protein [Nonomuraea sp. NBC_01738]|uniref:helix-turn-helix domain-containing protein n=1 Tax=Nonomuraea sp. NBC_01738 TaxID=2976003 RepID=UPI002E116D7D|nr:helix-turn-helix domain-containing protein [Nonomuraea sp. NBC_01738]